MLRYRRRAGFFTLLHNHMFHLPVALEAVDGSGVDPVGVKMLPVIAKHFTQRRIILLADRLGQRVCGLLGVAYCCWAKAASGDSINVNRAIDNGFLILLILSGGVVHGVQKDALWRRRAARGLRWKTDDSAVPVLAALAGGARLSLPLRALARR